MGVSCSYCGVKAKQNVSVTLWEDPSLAGEGQDTWQAAGNKENLLSIILAALPAVAAELI